MPGVVAAGDPHTAGAGAMLLRLGGNAVDAAIGATLAAFVAEPPLTGPFGGGFAMVGGPSQAPLAFDFFSDVPGRPATAVIDNPGMDFQGIEVDFGAATQIFHIGRAAAATPLLLPGLIALHQAHGCLPLETVVGPARELAEHGVPISGQVAPIIRILSPILTYTEAAKSIYAPGGKLLQPGDLFINHDLARLLRELGQGQIEAAKEAMLREFSPPAGLLTTEDLAERSVDRYKPLRISLQEFEVELNPPPSSGGLLVAFGLRLFETVKPTQLVDDDDAYAWLFAAMVTITAARRSALDPAIRQGPESMIAAGEQFLSDSFVDAHRELFERTYREGVQSRTPPEVTLGSTTHISCIDKDGNACAITSSNGEGCGYVVPGTGCLANNFMGEEDLHPGGFHSRPPGTRLTSMMCPTLVYRDNKPFMALGTGGANRIRSALLQVMVHHLLRKAPIDVAVSLPRMHFEGGELCIEERGPDINLPTSVRATLARRIADIRAFPEPNMYFGGVHVAKVGGAGAGDLRRGGAVVAAP